MKNQVQEFICEEVECCGGFFVNMCWLGGMLINFQMIKVFIDCLKKLEEMFEDFIIQEVFMKKEIFNLFWEQEKLNFFFGGIKNMWKLFDVVFIIDFKWEEIVVKEVNKFGILVVVVVDINCDFEVVDYKIFGNDDVI